MSPVPPTVRTQDPPPYVVTSSMDAQAVVLMQCPLAGFQFHAGEMHWRQMRVGDPLSLVREPGNHHDPRAVRVEWHSVVLGYLPREANYMASQMLDRGLQVNARIAAMHEGADPWKRVMLEVEGRARNEHAAPPAQEKPPTSVHVNLGSFIAGPAPSKVALARAVDAMSEGQRQAAAITIARCSADIIGRLAMPVTGIIGPASRSVNVWGLLEITITHDGRSLTARGLNPNSSLVSLGANLATPISNTAWVGPFERILDRVAPEIDMGVILANLPEHWLERTLRRTFDGFVDFAAMRRAVLEFLAPDALTRSLANRIFDDAPTAEQFNWCGRHRDALCLAAVEHAPLLPFLRWVEIDGRFKDAEPMSGLSALLSMEGMEATAAKHLERWTYEPFSQLAQELADGESLPMLVGFANLLARLGVNDPPPAFFCYCAGAAARTFNWLHDNPAPFGGRLPDWFMRAMLREIERMDDEEDEIPLGEQVKAAMPWIATKPPHPDSNQCKAGWTWIMQQVRQFEIRRAKGEWPVPLQEMVVDGYRVVPIGTMVQLKTEAFEMKNCLENYADPCKLGAMAIFSIRMGAFPRGKPVADLAVVKAASRGAKWSLYQLAGKMNAPVPRQIDGVARVVLESLNPASRDTG